MPTPPPPDVPRPDLWNRIQKEWSHMQIPARIRRMKDQLKHFWSELSIRDRRIFIACCAAACVLLIGMVTRRQSTTEHPVELVIEYTVNGKVEQRTPITPTFCAIPRDTGRIEIGWKREPHIQFNEVWLGYNVGYENKERQMFGYWQNNTDYVTSTKPENGEYFLSVSLKDFPAAKHQTVRAVSLKFNLTQHVEQLTKNIQEAVGEDKKAQLLKGMLGGMARDAEDAQLGTNAASSRNYSKVIESMFGSADQEALADALNVAAWFLATYPVDAIRDGKKALEYSEFLLEKPQWLNAVRLDTLAASYAECGNFENAVKYQTQAVEKVSQEARDEYNSRLRLYQNRKPCRQW